MQPEIEISQYGAALVLMLAGVVVAVGLVAIVHLLSPRNPTPEKQLTYECGEDPVGNAWLRFNIRFYIVALVFVLFDVEVALIYPVAAIFKGLTADAANWRPALIVCGELFFFVAVLLLGLIYVWQKGDLGWIRSFRTPPAAGMRSWEKPAAAAVTPSEKSSA